MEADLNQQVEDLLNSQRNFFSTQTTKAVNFRLEQLKKLREYISNNKSKIAAALWTDLHKSPEEAYLTEISIVFQELDNHIKHLKAWSKQKKVSTPLTLFPSKSKIIYEPLGCSLIIAPWNYPFHLLINPLIGAISSGCCAVLKPSPYAPTVAQLIGEMVSELFDTNYIACVQGHREVNQVLLEQKFDFIFFTGSPSLGKVVMRAAAEHLTPLVLELGGKSPCIVDKDADIDVAAKRIAWGKCINAGQTCIAPDYLLVHRDVKEQLLEKIKENIELFFGQHPKESPYYPRLVTEKVALHMQELMQSGVIIYGGEVDAAERYVAPTILDKVSKSSAIMQEEIFGPLLPVLSFDDLEEAVDYINANEKPLALYYFGCSKQAEQVLAKTSSGGACINDTLMHIANHHLPFGGVGNSGLGKYHGYDSFLAFSNQRGVLSTTTCFDLPFKYVPFKYFSTIKRFLLS